MKRLDVLEEMEKEERKKRTVGGWLTSRKNQKEKEIQNGIHSTTIRKNNQITNRKGR
jgi:hypothetical protein